MTEEMIEARVLQEKTRDLLDLLQRIRDLPPEYRLPVDEVSAFTGQVGRLFLSGFKGTCLFQGRRDCHIGMPPDWNREAASKKMK